jgi:5'-nucleotidase
MVMTEPPEILLTNDDGIKSEGIRTMYDALSEIGDVTVVAPAENQSAVGRLLSYSSAFKKGSDNFLNYEIETKETDIGYVLEGTPGDCVIAGVSAFDNDPDVIVSGCNPGANVGDLILFRSGTLGGAIESAHLGIPGIGVSIDSPYYADDIDRETFTTAARITRNFLEHGFETDLFSVCDWMNMNLPYPVDSVSEVRITDPIEFYEMDASYENGNVVVQNRHHEELGFERSVDIPRGTDVSALVDGEMSVSGFEWPYASANRTKLELFAESFTEKFDFPPST